MGLLESLLAQNQPAAPSPLAPSGDGQASLPQVAQQQAEATGMPPSMANQHTRGMLKQMLTRFAYGMGQSMTKSAGLPTDQEIANDQAQRAHLNAQTGLVNAQSAQMGQMITLPNGVTMPYGLASKVYGAMITGQSRENAATTNAGSRVDVANINATSAGNVQDKKNEGALDQVAAKQKAQDKLANDYVSALQGGDTAKASNTLKQLHDLTGATAKPTSMSGKVDPIINSYLGASPDPATDPAGAKVWAAEAEKIKTRMAVAPRVAGYAALNMGRAVQAYDPETDTYKFNTLGGAMHDGLMPAQLAYKNMPKVAQFGEMTTASHNLRDAITHLDVDFTPAQRAKLQLAMTSPSESVLSNEIGAMLGSEQLTPAQQDYVIWSKQMMERVLSLRSVAGMGQGSEDMRKAIQGTLPNVRSADKGYSLKQLDAVDQQIGSLFQGIGGKQQMPNSVPSKVRHGMGAAQSGPKEGETKTNSSGDRIVFRGGKWGAL